MYTRVDDCSAGELTAETINAADTQNHEGDDVEGDGGLLDEARLWNAARLLAIADDDDADVLRQELLERLRRSSTGLGELQNGANNRENAVNDNRQGCQEKRRRRPPVDPTLLMMGIGKRK